MAASTAVPQSDADASSVALAAKAAQDCLATAGLLPEAVGVLINTGVYRESNTFEPAMAALVQKEVGINLDYLAHPVPGGGFSFDLMNGACGVLNAVQVARALLETNSTKRVLVTAADVHPGGRAGRDDAYPYADLGAAWLLAKGTEPDTGFGQVLLRGSDNCGATTAGYLDISAAGPRGRHQITVQRDADWAEHLLDLTAATVTEYARTQDVDLNRTLVVCSRPTPDFAARLAQRLALDPEAVVAPDLPGGQSPHSGEPHTAAPVLGYLQAVEGGLAEAYGQMLFVAAGAGPSTACVSYHPQGR
ncbi:hypothetical protein [Streptomyces inhibens]|nr:hypothetical protein [Streptomyces inhibens]